MRFPRAECIRRLAVLSVPAALLVPALTAHGQDGTIAEEGYLTPPEEIATAVLAPRHRNVTLADLSPDSRYFVNMVDVGLPKLADRAKPHYNLGGLQIDAQANRSRRLTTRYDVGIQLISAEDGSVRDIELPAGSRVSGARWSPDGSRIAFYVHTEDATHIHVADASSGSSRRLTRSPVLATRVTSFQWSADGEHIFTVLVPEGRGPEPVEPAVAETPRVLTARDGEENRLRTYPSLLGSPHEVELVEYFLTGQLARIRVEDGQTESIGDPAMIQDVDVAPDGQHLRVTTTRKPFSYIVPVRMAASVEEVWDTEGNVLAEVTDTPLRVGLDEDDDEEDESGRRNVSWRPDGAGLSFLEREPAPEEEEEDEPEEEEDEEESERRDRVMLWRPPFDASDIEIVYENDTRLDDVHYSEDARTLFLTETTRDREHLFAVSLDDPETRHTLYRHHEDEDFYENPGRLMIFEPAGGPASVRTSPDGRHVYLSGTRYSEDPLEEAPRPFVDRVEIETGEKTRLFESAADVYETVSAVLDDDFRRVVISRESATEVPNSYRVDLREGSEVQLTDNVDHTPDITNARREIVDVTRARDGLTFRVEVTLPVGWTPGERPPAMFWFYPREFEDQESYDRSNREYNKNRFPSLGPRSMSILTRMGYTVVEPDAPIIGEPDRRNDSYVPDLRNNLAAVIDALDARGFIDRSRLGIGGHSYGAFGTANAMIHTPFFRAGIAGAGNYNRLLTPIGFQRENRDLWSAREVYLSVSPLLHAEQLSGAILLYHSMEDQNVGTFPINSERFYHALNGLGKTAVLYMYPYEDHGPVAEETILDLWTRWTTWLDVHVKNADQPVVAEAEDQDAEGADR